MEKLLQPGYKPQTRKEAIAIRRAQEELNLHSGENQQSQTGKRSARKMKRPGANVNARKFTVNV